MGLDRGAAVDADADRPLGWIAAPLRVPVRTVRRRADRRRRGGAATPPPQMVLVAAASPRSPAADSPRREPARSQVNILGLVVGYASLRLLNRSPGAVAFAFVILTAVHVVANVLAVRTLRFRSVNEVRFRILHERWRLGGDLGVAAVGDAEPLLPELGRDRVLLGAALADATDVPAAAAAAAAADDGAATLVLEAASGPPVVLAAPNATGADLFEARFVAEEVRCGGAVAAGRASWPAFRAALVSAGWDVSTSLLDDRGGRVCWRRVDAGR